MPGSSSGIVEHKAGPSQRWLRILAFIICYQGISKNVPVTAFWSTGARVGCRARGVAVGSVRQDRNGRRRIQGDVDT